MLNPLRADLRQQQQQQQPQSSLFDKMMGRKQTEWVETCCGSQCSNQYEPLKHLLHDGRAPRKPPLQPFATRPGSLFARASAVISYTWPINCTINMYEGGGAGLLVQGRLH